MTQGTKETVRYTLATHAAEKMKHSREAVRMCAEIAEGRLSGDSAVEQIKRLYVLESRETDVPSGSLCGCCFCEMDIWWTGRLCRCRNFWTR